MQAPRTALSEPFPASPATGGRSSTAPCTARPSLDASIGAATQYAATRADRLRANTRFDPRSKPAAAASAERATSWLGRAAASRGRATKGGGPTAQSVSPCQRRAVP